MPHPLTCSCSDCVLPHYVPDCGQNQRANENAQFAPAIAESVAADNNLIYFLYGIICGALAILLLVYLLGPIGGQCAVRGSYYYQDLNKIEMEVVPGSPIDPKVVEAIHHFQKYPYGDIPGGNLLSRLKGYYDTTVNLGFYLIVLIVVCVFVICLFG